MFGLWRPWQADSASGRSVTVTGTGKVTAQPDYYQFNPSYQKATTNELSAQLSAVTAKLKELGVQDKDIQLQGNAYSNPQPLGDKTTLLAPDNQTNYAYLTIKVSNKELAQKVQDYIATTGAQGQLTPSPSFSDEKQKQLKDQARDKAISDAKAQADKTAKNLGAKLGRVIEIKDSGETNDIFPMDASSSRAATQETKSSLPIFSGEQDVSFTVQATFEIK
jgi:hypothetical protein